MAHKEVTPVLNETFAVQFVYLNQAALLLVCSGDLFTANSNHDRLIKSGTPLDDTAPYDPIAPSLALFMVLSPLS